MMHSIVSGRSALWKITLVVSLLVLLVSAAALFAEEEADEHQKQGQKKGFIDILAIPRYWMAAIFAVSGLVLLMNGKVSWNFRAAMLPLIFFVFAVIYALPLGTFARYMGQHPSPVCTITKPILRFEAGEAVPVVFWVSFSVVAALSIAGNKLFCGWVCPIGAIQEFVNRVPLPKKMKLSTPFTVANAVRIAVFVLFVIVALAAGREIYEYFSPFEFLHWRFEMLAISIFAVLMVASLFLWRPFCYFLCPMGLLTWLLEHLSVVRVKVSYPQCDGCGICTAKSPCPAVPSILEERWSRPDCFACGRCIDLCPRDGLSFRA